MADNTLAAATDKCLSGESLTDGDVEGLLVESRRDIYGLLHGANTIRRKFFGDRVRFCSIAPARLGGCDQDCRFCAQSNRYNSRVPAGTVSDRQILDAAVRARQCGVKRFGVVCSGGKPTAKDLSRLVSLAGQIRSLNMEVCASAGMIGAAEAKDLADAGVTRYNHNLETSRRHFSHIVTTHTYQDRIKTIEAAKQEGLSVCAGGIFGIGENDEDRVQIALELRRIDVDTVPLNFLHPIAGTPLGSAKTLEPMEILRIVAFYRFMLPDKNLSIAGGRTLNLRELQSWIFFAGANAVLSGDYLTTAGRPIPEDMQMIADLGLAAE